MSDNPSASARDEISSARYLHAPATRVHAGSDLSHPLISTVFTEDPVGIGVGSANMNAIRSLFGGSSLNAATPSREGDVTRERIPATRTTASNTPAASNHNSGSTTTPTNRSGTATSGMVPENADARSPLTGLSPGIEQNIHLELSNMNSRFKFLIPFVLIIILKLALDNLIPFSLLLMCSAVQLRARNQFSLQLALKRRASLFVTTRLMVVVLSLLLFVHTFVQLYGYPHSLWRRLALLYPGNESEEAVVQEEGLMSTLWACTVVDCVVQALTLSMEILCFTLLRLRAVNCVKDTEKAATLVMGRVHRFLRLGSLVAHSHSHSHSHSSGGSHAVSPPPADIEGGGGGVSGVGALYTAGLARRANVNNNSTSNTSSVESHDAVSGAGVCAGLGAAGGGLGSAGAGAGAEAGLSEMGCGACAGNSERSDRSDCGDSEQAQQEAEAAEYLLSLRICSLISICGYIYRTVLPVPLWLSYLGGSGSGASMSWIGTGKLFPVLYLCCKVLDLSWKSRGVLEAFENFITNKLEFGHYSTEEELTAGSSVQPQQSGSAAGLIGDPEAAGSGSVSGGNTGLFPQARECPVCFDCPRRPVTLDCGHIFCEMCISEWLDKEKTCPVCRAEVKNTSTFAAALKEEAALSIPAIL